MTRKSKVTVVAMSLAMTLSVGLFGAYVAPTDAETVTVVDVAGKVAEEAESKCFVRDDLGSSDSGKRKIENYSPYADGEVSAENEYMKFSASSESETNGIKLDITSDVKKYPSGSVFGASLMVGAMDWQAGDAAEVFFEVTGSQAGKYKVATVDPNGDTLKDKVKGAMWYGKLVQGEAPIWYGDDSQISLCVTFKNKTQVYDAVKVWGYRDQHVDPADINVTTPELDGDKVSFEVTNLTEKDNNVKIKLATTVDGQEKTKEYDYKAVTGTNKQKITLPASEGTLLDISDESGKYFFKDYKLGSYKWVSTWANAEEKANIDKNAMPAIGLSDTTHRLILKVTSGGTKIRFKFSNQYGEKPLEIKSAHVAKQIDPKESDIDLSTDTAITFDGGKDGVTIEPGKVVVSDAIEFKVEALENLAVSAYYGSVPNTITSHRGGRCTNYLDHGNHVADEVMTDNYTNKSWYFLCDVSILSPEDAAAVVCFGDSITDGYGTDASYLGKSPDSYTRWGDYFAKRLKANEGTKNVTVLNEGIGSNSILGSYPTDAGKDRFKRDLLEHDGVKYCIILFGVNDLDKLPNANKANQLIPEYEKMVKLCHDNNIKVYGAPILPFGTSSYYSKGSEEARQMINDWMRSAESGFDGIVNFEDALKDPNDPKSLLHEYTKDDGLHPYEGYEVMANAIDLTMFENK